MDIKDKLEELVLELTYIDDLLNCIYDGYFACENEKKTFLERYGNMTLLSIKLLKQEREKLNEIVDIIFKKDKK